MTILYFYLYMATFLGVVLYLTKHSLIEDRGVTLILFTFLFGVVLFSLTAIHEQNQVDDYIQKNRELKEQLQFKIDP